MFPNQLKDPAAINLKW